MTIIIICVIIAIIAYLQFTKNGKQIKNVASGTVTEKIKENAMTPEGARARYNTAIKDKQDFYQKTMGTYTMVAGRLATMEDDLKETKEEISKTEVMINQYLDNNDDKKAMYYAQKLATLKAQKSVYGSTFADESLGEKKIPELQATKDKQEEIKNQAYDQLIKLKGEKDTVVLQMEADQQIAELQKNLDQYNSSNAAQEGLEEVREGAKKLSEQAKGVAIAYESSAETLDYHMEQEERQQEAQAILDQMKNARK